MHTEVSNPFSADDDAFVAGTCCQAEDPHELLEHIDEMLRLLDAEPDFAVDEALFEEFDRCFQRGPHATRGEAPHCPGYQH
jgi:hypothetical protein